jgi:D-beta-D-heptose 7-phosphate kinase/D-beta-D-heptose 1-phosphate adenosyltransferase
MGRVVRRSELGAIRDHLKKEGKSIVFTNGCFDILHRGHVEYLESAKKMGDILIVGVNDDNSVRRIKGDPRPVVEEDDRVLIIAALSSVDFVTLFSEDTPLELIRSLVPDILVKGADWPMDKVIGKDIVEAAGGTVKTIPFISNRSTSAIIQKILQSAIQR